MLESALDARSCNPRSLCDPKAGVSRFVSPLASSPVFTLHVILDVKGPQGRHAPKTTRHAWVYSSELELHRANGIVVAGSVRNRFTNGCLMGGAQALEEPSPNTGDEGRRTSQVRQELAEPAPVTPISRRRLRQKLPCAFAFRCILFAMRV